MCAAFCCVFLRTFTLPAFISCYAVYFLSSLIVSHWFSESVRFVLIVGFVSFFFVTSDILSVAGFRILANIFSTASPLYDTLAKDGLHIKVIKMMWIFKCRFKCHCQANYED